MGRRTQSKPPQLVLASSSPRRQELLARAGLTFVVAPPVIDETLRKGERPATYVRRLSKEKAHAVAPRFPEAVIVAADTSVVIDERVLGKPADAPACERMMRALSSREHDVLTGVTVLLARGGTSKTFTVRTRVDFDPIPPAWAKRYAATDEPYDKAGGYGLQGAAGTFIRSIHGSVTNVVGLPMLELLHALAELGYPTPWSSP